MKKIIFAFLLSFSLCIEPREIILQTFGLTNNLNYGNKNGKNSDPDPTQEVFW